MKKLLTALVTAAAIAITALVAVSPAGAQTYPEVDKEIAYYVQGGNVEIEYGEYDQEGLISGGEIYTDGTGVIEFANPFGSYELEIASSSLSEFGGGMTLHYLGVNFYGTLHGHGGFYTGEFRGVGEYEIGFDPIRITPAS